MYQYNTIFKSAESLISRETDPNQSIPIFSVKSQYHRVQTPIKVC